ncbi:hypothetical protein PYW07_000444 [Mythimna separata]|uniref:Uncharacterized protein n=1 Tax=Mythimna separata TaxID=271217 RepID=A0AAD7Z427_MYTSE|nr:hypothetical protein PYW07_000444 [Mythimna separata]
MRVALRTKENILEGTCVLIDGYKAGIAVIAIAAGLASAKTYPHFNPMSAYFYTNFYRWALRYISLLPFWIGGNGGNFCETTRIWRRRYYYMDEFIPPWLQSALFYVRKEEWAKEELEFRRFKKYAEPAFGKHYRFPTKEFNKFKSQFTVETIENPHEVSELSII